MQVNHHLNGRIFLQYPCNFRQGIAICLVPYGIVLCRMVQHVVAVILRQYPGKLIPHAHNGIASLPRHGVRKGFLRMGVVNQNLRSGSILFHTHIPVQQIVYVK